MKKHLIGILLLIISIFVVPTITTVKAENTDNNSINIDTLYPEGVLDYHNLTNISDMTVNDNYIAYTLNKISIKLFNTQSKNTTTIGLFNNIIDMKIINNQIYVVDYNENTTSGNIKLITLDNEDSVVINTLSTIDISNLRLIDIYYYNNIVYIGMIKNSDVTNIFELYTIDYSSETITPVQQLSLKSSYYNQSTILVINNQYQYVVYDYEDETRILINPLFARLEGTPANMLDNVQILKYFNNGSNEYLLAFTEETLHILDPIDCTSPLESFTSLNLNVKNYTDVDINNNQIIICDANQKLIKSYKLDIDEDITINSETLLLSSNNNSLGRFNNASNITIQGNTFYISDTKNNRIQIIDNNNCYQINNLETDSKPQSVILDSLQNIYFTVYNSGTNTSSIYKYTQDNNHNYTRETVYNSTNNNALICDSTIDINDNIYFIDYVNNNLMFINSSGVQHKIDFDDFTTNSESKIEYLIKQNKLVILNNNILYLLDINTNEILSQVQFTDTNCLDITVTYDSILALCNNEINLINIENNVMQISTKSLKSDTFSDYTCISADIINNKIYAFNTYYQSINYFDNSLTQYSIKFDDISNTTPLSEETAPFAIDVDENGLIYESVYYLGNCYSDITTCIGIEEFNNYYRVLFNLNDKLKVGFLHKDFATIKEHNPTKKIRVITTNIDTHIYKYPTLLKNDNTAIITNCLPSKTYLEVFDISFPTSIDNQTFYLYKNNGCVGYLFNADIVLDDDKHIKYLNTENASISAIGQEEIHIYDEDKTSILITLTNNTRIYVAEYDKKSEYTKVIYKNNDLNTTIEGYILTDYIKMDKLDNSKIALILIVVFSVIMLGIIITTYIIIKKKK